MFALVAATLFWLPWARAQEESDDGPNWVESLSKDSSVQFGAGTRISARFGENEADGNRWSNDFNLDNIRLYFGANLFSFLGVTLNTDINNAQGFEDPATSFEDAGEVRVVDAIARFEFHDYFNIWAGRFLPPSDRSNLDGPFYLTAWDFPYVQFGYPNIFQGRDDGAAIWGQYGEGREDGDMFGFHAKWQAGVFEGVSGGTNADDHLLYTGRLVFNFMDPEKGYYNSSTYHGAKDVLAVGAAAMYQEDSVGSLTDRREFFGYSFDFLYEKKLDSALVGDVPGVTDGVVTVEAAFYDFDDDDAFEADPGGTFTPITRQGESYFYLLAYLIPCEVGYGPVQGRLQPFFRYLGYRHSQRTPGAAGYFEEGVDLGVNYVLRGHDARLALVYQRRDRGPGANHLDTFVLGTQLQF